jgi:hypothetical protein
MKRRIERLTERFAERVSEQVTENEEIDQMLSREDEILPSSGFAASVMDAVRREAAAPPPIPFPWKRALPGMVAGVLVLALVLVAGIIGIAQMGKATTPQSSMSSPYAMPPFFHGGIESAATWTVLSLLVAFVSVKLSMRLASGRT